MNLMAPRCFRYSALSLTFIASNRASTGCSYKVFDKPQHIKKDRSMSGLFFTTGVGRINRLRSA